MAEHREAKDGAQQRKRRVQVQERRRVPQSLWGQIAVHDAEARRPEHQRPEEEQALLDHPPPLHHAAHHQRRQLLPHGRYLPLLPHRQGMTSASPCLRRVLRPAFAARLARFVIVPARRREIRSRRQTHVLRYLLSEAAQVRQELGLAHRHRALTGHPADQVPNDVRVRDHGGALCQQLLELALLEDPVPRRVDAVPLLVQRLMDDGVYVEVV
mmetsp:Transcript_73385/g.212394  ORF Transcript_73385/g.212394 Transcript_73385/m.212394 type:complete len:213 (+) Transcript_73385:729-1367(+)